MSITFINATGDTFTPTKSGAIGTWIWEVCRAANHEGERPLVISKDQAAAPYSWEPKILLPYPRVVGGRLATFCYRAHRKLSGWAEFGQATFAGKIAEVIAAKELSESVLLLQNDPELTVHLKRRFPKIRLIHHFQNQQECRPQFRPLVGGSAVILTACSSFTARWIENYYGLAPGSVRTLYSGVDLERFTPSAEPNIPIVNFIGRTGIEKAPDLLLSACLELAREGLKLNIQVLGSNASGPPVIDAYQRKLIALAGELSAAGVKTDMPGHVERADLPRYLRQSSINVVPSRWEEPFGLVALEGMACGLASVFCHTGGLPEVGDSSALFFERDNLPELVSQLRRLVGDAALRDEYRRKARARAELFPWSKTWSEVKALRESALEDIQRQRR